MKRTSIAALSYLAVSAATGLAASIAGPFIYPASGHSYLLLMADSWFESENEAMTFGGHLVTINDSAENVWIFSTFAPIAKAQITSGDPPEPALWIGLSDAAVEGTFTWASGEPVSFTQWDTGQPNSIGGDQDYVLMRGLSPRSPGQPGFWNDYINDHLGHDQFGVVEIVPEPSSFALMVSSALGVTFFRRRN